LRRRRSNYRLEEDAGGLMPARHRSLPTVASLGKKI
jgi:hypothetical protein